MKMIPVNSGHISSFGYDAASQVLHVRFVRGGSYVYHDVPRQVFDEMCRSSNKGEYLSEHIKGTYRYGKI